MKEIKDQLLESLLAFLDQLPTEMIVMIISCFPIIELRGALPVAMKMYHMPFWQAYFFSVLGNMLPVIPLLLLFQPLSKFMMRFSWYTQIYDWLYDRTINKSKNVEKYGALGLILFTAVPLPTTGAWTASVAACLFNIRFTYAFLAIFVGVLIAGMIVGMVTGVFSYSVQ